MFASILSDMALLCFSAKDTPCCSFWKIRVCDYPTLQVLDQNIDTNSATGRLLFNMLGAIAQFETEIQAERQREGIQKAPERGVRFGRRKKLSQKQVVELHKRCRQGILIKTLMQEYGLSKTSVYRYLKEESEH
jgi:DNA invertase Pin-like site-specific DNA recombinase